MKRILSALCLLLVFLSTREGLAAHPETGTITFHPAQSVFNKSVRKTESGNSRSIYIFESRKWLNKKAVSSMLQSVSGMSGVIFYNWKDIQDITASAPGTDYEHHLVNSYLVGYRPFSTTNIFIPWQIVAQKKKYQLDHVLSPGHDEVWQNSRQAYKYSSGDCEDHAIALADWLIDMGYDARVVIGNYKNSGHAWVVLLRNNTTFLLEATRKKRLKTMRSFPLAKLQTGYQPQYMFNRTHFWKNTGSFNTTEYSSPAWVKKSRYQRDS